MIDQAIARFKSLRTERFLSRGYSGKYAFVGMGQHSLSNLYPVLDYLKVPLKYVCVTSERKAGLVSRKLPGVLGVTDLDRVLSDDEVAGVFVAASPSAHFPIASKVLRSGKALFIEKPPCRDLVELDKLASLGGGIVEVGLQKRYAPAVGILRSRLSKDKPCRYSLRYRTGAYPEGDALLDLFIHPLDLVTFLFGEAEPRCCLRASDGTLLLSLEHGPGVVGQLELSTSGSWTSAFEILCAGTRNGEYTLSQTDNLEFRPSPGTILSVPKEKLFPRSETVECLYSRNGFNPVPANNQIVSSGYFGEIEAFVDAVEGRRGSVRSSLGDVRPTYVLMEKLKTNIIKNI